MKKNICKPIILAIMLFSFVLNLSKYDAFKSLEASQQDDTNKTSASNDIAEDIIEYLKKKTELDECDFEYIEFLEDINVKTTVNKTQKVINVFPEDEYKIFYAKDLKLSDILLPDGWEWEVSDTSLDVGEGIYKTVYKKSDGYTYIGETEKNVKVLIDKSVYNISGIVITVNEGTVLTDDILPNVNEGKLEWITKNEVIDKACIKTCKFTAYDTIHYNNINSIDVIINTIPSVVDNDSKDNNTGGNSTETNSNITVGTNDVNNANNTTNNNTANNSNTENDNKKVTQDIQLGISNTTTDNQKNNELGITTSIQANGEFQLPRITLGLGEDLDISDSNLKNNELVDIKETNSISENDEYDYNDKDKDKEESQDTESGDNSEEIIDSDNEDLTKNTESEDNFNEDEETNVNGKKNGIDLFGIIAILGVTGIGGYLFVNKIKNKKQ